MTTVWSMIDWSVAHVEVERPGPLEGEGRYRCRYVFKTEHVDQLSPALLAEVQRLKAAIERELREYTMVEWGV